MLRLGEQLEEGFLDQWVEPTGRLVQQQHIRLVEQRLHDPDLLFVPARKPADRPIQVGIEPLRDLVRVGDVVQPSQLCKQGHQLPAGHPVTERELGRQVPDVPQHLGGLRV